MNFASTSRVQRNQSAFLRSSLAGACRAQPRRPLHGGACGGQAAAGARHRRALQHQLAAVGGDRVQPAGARRRYRAGYPAAARQYRRTHRMRASPGAVLEGQRQLRRLGLCRTVRAESRCMAAAIASTVRCRSMACLKGRAPTASRRASMARPRPAPPSKPRRVRSSAGTGRSTSISATASDGASRRSCR